MEQARRHPRARFKRIDPRVHVDRVVPVEPVLDPLVVVLEVISKRAIREQVMVIDADQIPQLLPPPSMRRLRRPENPRYVASSD